MLDLFKQMLSTRSINIWLFKNYVCRTKKLNCYQTRFYFRVFWSENDKTSSWFREIEWIIFRSNSKVGSSVDECKRAQHCPCKESFAGIHARTSISQYRRLCPLSPFTTTMLFINQIISWIEFYLTVDIPITCARGRNFELLSITDHRLNALYVL